MLAIRLPEDIEARLDNLAKRTGRSKTFYAREAILEHLDDLEDLYLAEQIARRIRDGEERSSSLEEVEAAWFGGLMYQKPPKGSLANSIGPLHSASAHFFAKELLCWMNHAALAKPSRAVNWANSGNIGWATGA